MCRDATARPHCYGNEARNDGKINDTADVRAGWEGRGGLILHGPVRVAAARRGVIFARDTAGRAMGGVMGGIDSWRALAVFEKSY